MTSQEYVYEHVMAAVQAGRATPFPILQPTSEDVTMALMRASATVRWTSQGKAAWDLQQACEQVAADVRELDGEFFNAVIPRVELGANNVLSVTLFLTRICE